MGNHMNDESHLANHTNDKHILTAITEPAFRGGKMGISVLHVEVLQQMLQGPDVIPVKHPPMMTGIYNTHAHTEDSPNRCSCCMCA